MILAVYGKLEKLVLQEFADIIVSTSIISSATGRARKLRLNLFDETYIDIWLSGGREYSFHWERTAVGGKLFRHDNAPHDKWKKIKTFPKHFHNGSNNRVIESYINSNPFKGVKEFLAFARKLLIKQT